MIATKPPRYASKEWWKQSSIIQHNFLAYQFSFPNATEKQMRKLIRLLRAGVDFEVSVNGNCIPVKRDDNE